MKPLLAPRDAWPSAIFMRLFVGLAFGVGLACIEPLAAVAITRPPTIGIAPRQARIALAVVLHDHPLVRRLLAQSLSFFTRWRSGSSRQPRYPAFDPFGRHIDTRNALTGAITTKFAYTASGLLASETDGDGNVLTIQRDSNGNATAILAPGGQRTALAMDANGYLASVTDSGGHAHQFSYSAGGLMASHTTPRGFRSAYTYDSLGRVTKDADPQGGFLSVSANELTTGVDITLTTAEGRVSQRQRRYLPDGSQQQRFVEASGAVTLVTQGADGSQMSLLPDGRTKLATVGADPRWGMQAPLLTALTVTTPGGLTFNAQSSRAATLTTPGQPLSLSSQVDSATVNGDTFTSRFDSGSRTLIWTSAMGHVRQFALDPQARLASLQVDPVIDPVTITRNSRGEVTQLQQGSEHVSIGYDSTSLLMTSVTYAQSHQTQFAYTGADLLQFLIAPDQGQYKFDHDESDNVSSLTMPSGDVHGFAYDKLDQLTQYTPPQNPTVAPAITSYNLDRQLKSAQFPTGRTVAAAYDAGGRPSQLAYPEGSVQISYVGATSRVQSFSGSVGGQSLTTYNYDGPFLIQMTMAGASTGQYRYRYDNNFLLAGYALDQEAEIAIGRDRDGSITQHGPFTYARNGPAGAVSQITDGTLTIDYAYTPEGRLASKAYKVGGLLVYKLQLTHDSAGNISQKIESVNGISHTFAYDYDSASRLQRVQVDGVTAEQYQYDRNDNRVSRGLGGNPSELATFDGQDRLKSLGPTGYRFNDDGQMIQRGAVTFQYTARGELTGVSLNGNPAITFAYDGHARRVNRADSSGILQYLYGFGGALVTATRSSSGVLTQFFYDSAGQAIAFRRGGITTYVATDQVGSPRLIVDATGTVLRTVTYDSFGVVTSDSNPSADFPLGFAGGLTDGATGLLRFRWRDYDPQAGRWTAKDPIGFTGGLNLYAYAQDDPISLRDPLGLDPGDNYVDIISAAIDLKRYINPKSIKENKEYSAAIYETDEGFFSFTEPQRYPDPDPKSKSKPSPKDESPQVSQATCPKGTKYSAHFHTHAASDPDYDNENFSDKDKKIYEAQKVPGFIATPDNDLKQYIPDPKHPGKGTEITYPYAK